MSILLNDLRIGINESKLAKLGVDFRRVWVKDKLISYFLSFVYNHKQYRKLVFYGGTCARVIYGLDRLSEDIDLHNPGLDVDNFGEELAKFTKQEMGIEGADIYEQGGERGIKRFVVRMPILHELRLSPHQGSKLHVKLEMSGGEQTYTGAKTPIVRDGQSMVIRHFDEESLMAGKMIACMERVYRQGDAQGSQIKGRDFYDLLWYLRRGIKPNAAKLADDGDRPYKTEEAWKILSEKIPKITRKELAVDLRAFVAEPVYLEQWLDNFHQWYERYLGSRGG